MKIVSIINGINNYVADMNVINDGINTMRQVALRTIEDQGLACITPFKIMRNRHYNLI